MPRPGMTGDLDPDPIDPPENHFRGVTDPTLFEGVHADFVAQLDRERATWRPEPGDQIAGTVLSVEMNTSEYGDYPVIELDVPAGPIVAVHAFHTVLRNQIDRAGCERGDFFASRYEGRVGDKDMASYRTIIRHPQER